MHTVGFPSKLNVNKIPMTSYESNVMYNGVDYKVVKNE